jgi:hypothetical protein
MRCILTGETLTFCSKNLTRLSSNIREIGVREIICIIGESDNKCIAKLQRLIVTLETHDLLTARQYRQKDYAYYILLMTWRRAMRACIISLENDNDGIRPSQDRAVAETIRRGEAVGITPTTTDMRALYTEFYADSANQSTPISVQMEQLFGSTQHYVPDLTDISTTFDLVVILQHRSTNNIHFQGRLLYSRWHTSFDSNCMRVDLGTVKDNQDITDSLPARIT